MIAPLTFSGFLALLCGHGNATGGRAVAHRLPCSGIDNELTAQIALGGCATEQPGCDTIRADYAPGDDESSFHSRKV